MPGRPYHGSVGGRRAVQWIAQCILQLIDIAGHDVPNAPRIGMEVLVDNSVADAGIARQGISGCAALNAGLMPFAASPMSAMEYSTDRTIVGFAANAAKSRPVVSARMSAIAEMMS